ncbi:MAG TPA: HAD-IA family hydrolase [Bacillota bacterium]|nr:HAD-IA family hydrolase [Bacillota bacterium]
MVKYLIFDFDGTIADTFKIVEKFALALAERYGVKMDSAEAKRIGLKQALEKVKFPMWKLPSALLEIKKAINQGIKEEVTLFDGMRTVLEQLRKEYNLAILSSNSRENIVCFLERNQIHNLFSFVHSDSSLFGKHVVLKRLCKSHGFTPEEMVYIGDEDRDIQAAKHLKVPVIAVSWGYNDLELLRKEGPDYLVDSPEEILAVLMR